MASDVGFVEHVCDQVRGVGRVAHKKMFGEYAIYVDDKLVALVCDDQLFLKPTPAGRALLGTPVEAPPYPGAKPSFLIEDQLDQGDFLTALFRATANALPGPKPRRPAKTPTAKREPAARKRPAAKRKQASKRA